MAVAEREIEKGVHSPSLVSTGNCVAVSELVSLSLGAVVVAEVPAGGGSCVVVDELVELAVAVVVVALLESLSCVDATGWVLWPSVASAGGGDSWV